MTIKRLEEKLMGHLEELQAKGMLKGKEKVITGIKTPKDGFGPRYLLADQGKKEFLRMNSNSYLGLEHRAEVVGAEEEVAEVFGAGPGAVRFISGTYQSHVTLEEQLARFHGREKAMLFSSAYSAMLGTLPPLVSEETLVLSDALNHNCIINAIRLSKPKAKAVYRHLDMTDLEQLLRENAGQAKRVILVTDGIFSMRGDHAPLDRIADLCAKYEANYDEGILTVVDDSHGVGAFGKTGRGTEEYTSAKADILVATLGKSLGVNGGYVASSGTLIDYLKESAPTYIYSNPITPAEAAAALKSLEILDSPEGLKLLVKAGSLAAGLREGLKRLNFETIPGEHPIVPLLVRDTQRTSGLVKFLFDHGILATGLNFPVVPRGEEEIRFQVNASHTEKDLDHLLEVLQAFGQSTVG